MYTITLFERDAEQLENSHYANTVRYKVKQYLCADSTIFGYQLKDLPNNGIEIFYQGFCIKCLKGKESGEPPSAGRSRERKKFYRQPLLFEDIPPKKLVITWKVNGTGLFLGLNLVAISQDSSYRPKFHWMIEIPHPSRSIEGDFESVQNPTELEDIRPLDDLDIQKQGTDNQ
jgi:hypothetical protein